MNSTKPSDVLARALTGTAFSVSVPGRLWVGDGCSEVVGDQGIRTVLRKNLVSHYRKVKKVGRKYTITVFVNQLNPRRRSLA